jgi:hypothetical protein
MCRETPEAGYLELPCQGLEDTLSIRFVPWPWDLRSDVLLREYLLYRVETGQIDADAAWIDRATQAGESS